MSGHTTNLRLKLPIACVFLQFLTILLFALFIQYDAETSAKLWHEELALRNKSHLQNEFYLRYPSEYSLVLFYFVSIPLSSQESKLLTKIKTSRGGNTER